jgi:hypothetical protein
MGLMPVHTSQPNLFHSGGMVAAGYWYSLLALAVGGLFVRLVVRRPLGGRRARPLAFWESALAAVTLVALVFHCGAMFFTAQVDAIPFASGAESAINDLGLTSKLAYALPAALFVLAVQRLWPVAVAALALSLSAVGVTMYKWWGLNVHLTAIATAITLIVITWVALVGRSGARSSPRASVLVRPRERHGVVK